MARVFVRSLELSNQGYCSVPELTRNWAGEGQIHDVNQGSNYPELSSSQTDIYRRKYCPSRNSQTTFHDDRGIWIYHHDLGVDSRRCF